MKKQIIVAIGREHGNGGHYIADMVARELGIKRYHDTWMLLHKYHMTREYGTAAR